LEEMITMRIILSNLFLLMLKVSLKM